MSKQFSFFVLSCIFAIGLSVSSAVFADNNCSQPCDAQTCLHPVCGVSGPYRCQSNNVYCFHNTSNAVGCTGGCCDVRACATQKCDASCPASVCSAAAPACPSSASFVCLEGQAKNGCGSASSFINNSACGECCDVSTCPSNQPATTASPGAPPAPPPPSPTNATPTAAPASFNCSQPCNKTVCAAQFRCSETQPFECTSGRSAGGCSSKSGTWPSAPQFCDSCCDVRTCQTTCGVCPANLCFAPVCSAKEKYTCTAGADKNGCSASPTHWSQTGGCSSCCYCKDSGKVLLGGLKN